MHTECDAAKTSPPRKLLTAIAGAAMLAACGGSGGSSGAAGPTGPTGPQGCPGIDAGQSAGLSASVTMSAPSNGLYFVAGERPSAIIRFADRCQAITASALGTANLYAYGPRDVFASTASKLLDCIVDRNAADHQHHFVNLKSPRFLSSLSHLNEETDGTLTFTFSAVTDEPPGTYTVAVWAKGPDGTDQALVTADLQLGTASPQTYASGPEETSTCFDCHRSPGDEIAEMHHAHASDAAPTGNWALDLRAEGSCKACHNVDGYSLNPLVRKAHGVHRGRNQLAAGAAHPDYGLGADATLPEYSDVTFPAMPGSEKDCARCHADDRWMTRPSRLACGTCHDNLYFDTGLLSPPRVFGRPPSQNACASSADCASYGAYAVCDLDAGDASFGACIHDVHPAAESDATCAACHNESGSAPSPVSQAHEIVARTRAPGLELTGVVLHGATGPGGTFQIGDLPSMTFHLGDAAGPITDLALNSSYSLTVLVAGPTEDRQRLFPALSKTGGTLLSVGGGAYTFTFPSPIPISSDAPFGATGPLRVNPAGTYTAWLSVYKTFTIGNVSARDVANAIIDFSFLLDGGIRPRRVVAEAACNACHAHVQAHGGSRDAVEMCSSCHTRYAVDPSIDRPDQAVGAQCHQGSTVCGAFQMCLPAPAGVAPPKAPNDGYCILTTDPTPGNTIEFGPMMHAIHFARLRRGYAERSFLQPYTGKLVYVGFPFTVIDHSDSLLPEDVRGCTTCHTDQGDACSSTSTCGAGQACVESRCANVAWQVPSSRACLSCHDTDYAAGHAALNTWESPDGELETCQTCHGTSGVFSVEAVHRIRNPYVPEYPRQPL